MRQDSTVVPPPRSPQSLYDSVAATIKDALHYCPQSTQEEAIKAALQVARRRGSLLECIDAAGQTLIANGYRFVHGTMMFAAGDHETTLQVRLQVATELLHYLLPGYQRPELERAIARAERVIRGNGTIGAALYFGVGPDVWFGHQPAMPTPADGAAP